MTTQPFQKPDVPQPASSAWLVFQVGEAVEIVHVGRTTPDVVSALDRMAALFGDKAIALAGDVPDALVGIRLESADADGTWRALLGRFGDNTKVDTRRVLLGFNPSQYIALAKKAGIR